MAGPSPRLLSAPQPLRVYFPKVRIDMAHPDEEETGTSLLQRQGSDRVSCGGHYSNTTPRNPCHLTSLEAGETVRKTPFGNKTVYSVKHIS